VNDLTLRLTTRNIKVGAQTIAKPLKQEEAQYNRDAMVKALYNGLFNWTVTRINSVLYTPAAGAESKSSFIGILDVFGFECSDWNNSFEQFCINYANERLHQFFNRHIVINEQEEYVKEGLVRARPTDDCACL
jgi:myosin heavy subunit